MKVTHVKFEYFKQGGKYYSEGEHDVPYDQDEPVMFWKIVPLIRDMLNRGEYPGLVDGPHDFHVLVTIYTEYGPLTHLFAHRDGAPF